MVSVRFEGGGICWAMKLGENDPRIDRSLIRVDYYRYGIAMGDGVDRGDDPFVSRKKSWRYQALQ